MAGKNNALCKINAESKNNFQINKIIIKINKK